MNKPNKPFILEYTTAKNSIISEINKALNTHNIPYFLIEEILFSALQSIKAESKIERDRATISYNQQLAEYEDFIASSKSDLANVDKTSS
jgi:hypothetical protein